MIKIETKGLYMFDWEIDLLSKKLGFEFKKFEINKKTPHSVRVLEDPEPVKSTPAKIKFLQKELPHLMNAIEIKKA